VSAYYNEIDPYAAGWLRNLIAAGHIPAGEVDTRSIVDVSAADVVGFAQCHWFAGIGGWPYALRLAGWPDTREVWTGSCPCQPFSQAGRAREVGDERHLWPAFCHLIGERRPPVVFGEQVASALGRSWLAGVRADLEALGYGVGAADLCAAGVGAPHIRQRLWWVADADMRQRGRIADGEGRIGNGSPAGWKQGDSESQRGCAARDVADPNRERREGQRLQLLAGESRPAGAQAAGRGEAGELGHADEPGSQGQLVGGNCAHQRPAGAAGVAGWADCEWVWCSDGKYRPIEPGTFPLAHGAPARVGRLRAYGNAIVPQVAAEFVMAFMECAPTREPGEG
jgi:DNA (cytosine-5)-methyltransferase 1